MRRQHIEENQMKRHSSLLAIRSRSRYLNPQRSSVVPWHAVFIFLIPVLLGVLQLHCQASNKSPLETHLPSMLAFLFALFNYCASSYYYFNIITSRAPPFQPTATASKVCAHLALLFGSLASASLISVLLPPHFGLLVFVAWIILIILYFSINLIMLMLNCLYLSSKTAASYIFGLWKRMVGKPTVEVEQSYAAKSSVLFSV